ncbi:NAD-dependent epimerase/dehydratase family protein [Baekduia soli]|uniref:NAD-dependent epimerase/dehydratase family protein n=1 Tax=Baekduia soli TaxID=496014 RepID=A0A5B8U5R5_9ACTN|nr:SDR family oxidoreductase [Baekduia soli]QEC47992.1 NAD-dependent epimerase/dehydratase family protein [Baekduia soli]
MTHADRGGLLLTGASGFVGQSLLLRWLRRTDLPATVLVRAADDRAAQARVAGLLEGLGADDAQCARIRALAADMTDFDPADVAARVLATGAPIDHVVHSAACVRFDQELEAARAVNVQGTSKMLDVAQRLHAARPLRRYVQVSTAYVSGAHDGSFGEDDRRVGQAFRNTYEQSKLESEELVTRHAAGGLPVQIVRPSIVVGDRESGWTAAFNVLYVPLRALVAGAVAAVPEHDTGVLDVVPVDYVADAILSLSDAPADGRVYHLTAGRHAITVGQLADAACKATGQDRPSRVSAETFAATLGETAAGRVLAANLGDYLPYLDVRTTFDSAGAEAYLAPRGVRVTPVTDYLPRLIAFAQERRWGRVRGALAARTRTLLAR